MLYSVVGYLHHEYDVNDTGSRSNCRCYEPPEGINVSRSTDSRCSWPLDVRPQMLFVPLKGLKLAFSSAENEGRQFKGGKWRLYLLQRPLLAVADGDKDPNYRNAWLLSV